MTVTQAKQFQSLEEYLDADPAQLPKGRFEYWDGELLPVMSEPGFNTLVANWLFFALVNAGVPIEQFYEEIVFESSPDAAQG